MDSELRQKLDRGDVMKRYQAIQEIMKVVTDELVVCNIGHPSQELFQISDRPRNFYMLGSMGLAPSIGLGLAMSTKENVIVINGDAAATMNLGYMATVGYNRPPNLVDIIIDNQANGSTGFQPSFTANRLKLQDVGRACGIENVYLIEQQTKIAPTLAEALHDQTGSSLIIVKTDVGLEAPLDVIPMGPGQIRDRFMAELT